MQDFEKIFSLLKKIDTLSFEEVDIALDNLKIHTKKNKPAQLIKNKTTNQEKNFYVDEEEEEKNFVFRSPIIGTLYLTPGPDDPPFIQVGEEIKIGQTVCLIEAMKIFNEIKSDVNGVVPKILIDNESLLEYNQEIFIIKKF